MRHVAPTLRILSEKGENEDHFYQERGVFQGRVVECGSSVTPDLSNQAAGKFQMKHRSLPPARLHYKASHWGRSPACCCWGCRRRKVAKGDQTNSDRCVWWAAMGETVIPQILGARVRTSDARIKRVMPVDERKESEGACVCLGGRGVKWSATLWGLVLHSSKICQSQSQFDDAREKINNIHPLFVCFLLEVPKSPDRTPDSRRLMSPAHLWNEACYRHSFMAC